MLLRLCSRAAVCSKVVSRRHASGRVQVGLASVFSVDLLKPEEVAGLQGFVVLSPDAFSDKNMLPKLLHSMVGSAAEATGAQSAETALAVTDASRTYNPPSTRKHVNMIVPAARVEELFKQLGLDAGAVITPLLGAYTAAAPLEIAPSSTPASSEAGSLISVTDINVPSSVELASALPASPLGRLLAPSSSGPTPMHLSSVHLGNGLSHVTRVATQASAIHVPILPGHGSSVAELNQEEQPNTRSKNKDTSSTNEDIRKQLLNAARECDVVKLALLLDGNTGGQLQPHVLLEGLIDEETGASPLHALVTSVHAHDSAEDCVAGIDLLLSNGNDVNARAGNGSTALHWAAGAGNIAAVKALLSRGADPLIPTYTWRRQVFGRGSGQLALHWAAESNQLECVRLLAGSCVSAAVTPDERGVLPADLAKKEMAYDSENYLQKLIETPSVPIRVTLTGSAFAVLR